MEIILAIAISAAVYFAMDCYEKQKQIEFMQKQRRDRY